MTERRIKLNLVQRKIAQKMSESKRIIPHVTTIREIRMDTVSQTRQKFNKDWESKVGKLSFMPFIMKAVADAIKEFPIINSSFDEDNNDIIIKEDINLGFAVAVGDKLLVPVVKNVENMSFIELAKNVNEIINKSRNGKLSAKDMMGGTFTITNSGALGGEIFTPIINYPESAILGIGRIQKKPIVAENDNIIPCPMMYTCLSYDHRIINGSTAVKFLVSIENKLRGMTYEAI